MRDTFANQHPIVNFIFYIAAIGLGMCFSHPLFLCISLCLSISYYQILKNNTYKFLIGMGGLFLLLSFGNPLFSPYGDTILFTYFHSRPYTYEALYFGFSIAAMFVSIITWFSTYNEVMTSDKFLYCFGRCAPAVSLILTMMLRLIPNFQKKTEQIAGARKCIGMSAQNGTKSEKIEHGLTIVSALTSWALEGGVLMADSMRSRGFGCGKRTSFSIYKLQKSDKYLITAMIVLIFTIIVCAGKGGMEAVYLPTIHIQGVENPWTIFGGIAYLILLSIPIVLHILEAIIWHILKSKI